MKLMKIFIEKCLHKFWSILNIYFFYCHLELPSKIKGFRFFIKVKNESFLFFMLLIVELIFFLQPVGLSHQMENQGPFQLYKLSDLANPRSS